MEIPWPLVDRIKKPVAVLLFLGMAVQRAMEYSQYALKPLWFFETLVFVTLGIAYVFRMPPRVRAQGWREIVLPYGVAALPFAFIWLPWSPWVDQVGPSNPLVGQTGAPARLLAVWILMIIGEALTVTGILTLLRSFSITVEVRRIVTSGPYRWMRHPIYLGEGICTAAMALLRASILSAAFLAAFLALQVYRARLEERKLSQASSEYQEYRERTGMFWPR